MLFYEVGKERAISYKIVVITNELFAGMLTSFGQLVSFLQAVSGEEIEHWSSFQIVLSYLG